MKRIGFFCIFAAASLLMAAPSEEFGERPERPSRREGRGGMRRERGMGGGMMFKRVIAEEELAQKYPKEMGEIFAARLKQEEQMAELARKGEVELPASMEYSLLKLRAADPKTYSEAVALLKTSPREGMKKLRALAEKHGIELFKMPGRRGGERPGEDAPPPPRAIGRVDLKMLRKKYPEEMKEYEKLRSTDKEKARVFLMDLVERDRGSAKEK